MTQQDIAPRAGRSLMDRITPRLASLGLWAMSISCRLRPSLRGQLESVHPNGQRFQFEALFCFTTRDGDTQAWARFAGGRMTVGAGPPAEPADVTVILRDAGYMRRFFSPRGDADMFGWLLDQNMTFDGNLAALAKFGQIASAVATGARPRRRSAHRPWPGDGGGRWDQLRLRRVGEPCDVTKDEAGTRWLDDPALAHLTLADFPRLRKRLHLHLHDRPRVCTERARLYTEAALRERRSDDPPVLRQARIFAHVMRNKRAIIHEDKLT